MIARFLQFVFWHPFAAFCYMLPIVPLNLKIKEVVPGIQLLIIDNLVTKFLSKFAGGFDYATFYIIDKEVVFDTGFSWSARRLKKYLKQEVSLKIKYIINSHEHEDHTGNNIVFKDHFPESKILAHPQALKEIIYPKAKPFYRNFLFGPDKELYAESIIEKNIDTSKRKLEVIHTPGHTSGHIVLYDPDSKVLLSGDLFISENLDTQLEGANGPDWIKSLEKIINYDIQLILDGHGVIIKGDECKESLVKKHEFLIQLRDKTRATLAKGPITERNLIKIVFNEPDIINFVSSNEGWMSVITSGDFSRSNLIRSFIDEYLESKMPST